MFACLVREPAAGEPRDGCPERSRGILEAIARACSPRVEPHGEDAVIFDAGGLSRVCGPPEVIAEDVTALAASQAIVVRVGLAGTRTAAWLLAHARRGSTVVAPGQERAVLASLPVGWLGVVVALDQERLAEERYAHGLRLTEELQPPTASAGKAWAGWRGTSLSTGAVAGSGAAKSSARFENTVGSGREDRRSRSRMPRSARDVRAVGTSHARGRRGAPAR
jgi:hypothetical protein